MKKSGFINYLLSKDWLLLVFLSFVPVLILTRDWNPEGEKAFHTEKLKNEWYKATEDAANQFEEISTIDYWARLTASRFKNICENSLYKTNNLSKSFNLAAKSYRLTGSPECILWGVTRNENNSNFKLHSGQFFCNEISYLIRNFFKQLYLQTINKKNSLSSIKWLQRLKHMFGQMTTSFMFSNRRLGIPLPVVYKNKAYLLVCELIKNHNTNKIGGGLILLFPSNDDDYILIQKLAKKNWNIISGRNDLELIFMPLSQQTDTFTQNSVDKFRKTHPKNIIDVYDKFVTHAKSTFNNEMRQVRLPSEMIGQIFKIGNKLARFCTLSHQSQTIGLLVSKNEQIVKSTKSLLIKYVTIALLMMWAMILIRTLVLKKAYLSLKYKFILWFVSFSMVPVSLSIGAWSSLIKDSRESKIKILEYKLQKEVSNIESNVDTLKNRYQKFASSIFIANKDAIIALAKKPLNNEAVLTKILGEFHKIGIKPDSVICVVQGGWLFSKFAPGSKPSFIDSSKKLIGNVFGGYLRQAHEKIYNSLIPKDKKLLHYNRVPVLAGAKDFNVQDNISMPREYFNKVSNFKVDDKNYLHFFKPLYVDDVTMSLAVVIWDCSKEYEKLIKLNTSISLYNFNKKEGVSTDAEIYNISYDQLRSLSKIGNISGLKRLTQNRFRNFCKVVDKKQISLVIPLKKIPGYIFTIRSSLSKINKELEKEKQITLIALSTIIVASFYCAWLLASWMTSPIKRIKNKLSQFKLGNKSIQFNEARKDEIGATSQALEKMKEWLLERERLTGFVAPQVLDIVTNGNLVKTGIGTFHEATILVSDIRSFTTISETFDEKLIFESVNTHLSLMAAIVEKWNGSIDRFVGDAIWAVFYGDKNEKEKMTNSALNASVEMMIAHQKHQLQRQNNGKFTYAIGIGIDQGRILAGVMGNKEYRLDFSIMGKAVQDAEEIEGLSKMSKHTNIVLSPKIASYAKSKGMLLERIETERKVYELKKLELVQSNA